MQSTWLRACTKSRLRYRCGWRINNFHTVSKRNFVHNIGIDIDISQARKIFEILDPGFGGSETETKTMSKPIALVLGAGKGIGASTAQMLRTKGYRVALAARSLKRSDEADTLHLTADLAKPESVTSLFSSLRESWGEPNVVFYNGTVAELI
jgi:D-arabinose 1-dehydrogenase-like Zn-dependent alcohol dehydrogenase